MKKSLAEFALECHEAAQAKGFYGPRIDPDNVVMDPMRDPFFVATKLALIQSECSEALEALRTYNVVGFHEELVDILIRTFDLIGAVGFPVDQEYREKLAKNAARPIMHNKAF
jgi:NTP pyrophosphatase (non-canonical NTP hydrolase)